ncbi:MAG: hypothetical protein JXQ97_17085 [Natronospirillum sp.]
MKRLGFITNRSGLLIAAATAVCVLAGPVMADTILDQWRQRAAIAQERLNNADFDACDVAYEYGFSSARQVRGGDRQTFEVTFQSDGQSMRVSYIYEGALLDSFVISALSPQWIAYQKVNNKTLTVIIPEERCAFDICTNDPFAIGFCSGESLE